MDFCSSHSNSLLAVIQIGIAWRLHNPNHDMLDLYGEMVIKAVQYAALFLAAFLGCCLVPCIVVWLARELCTINVLEIDV